MGSFWGGSIFWMLEEVWGTPTNYEFGPSSRLAPGAESVNLRGSWEALGFRVSDLGFRV